MDIPIISDTTHALSKAYGVLKEDEGIAYRGLFIIDTKGNSQLTHNLCNNINLISSP